MYKIIIPKVTLKIQPNNKLIERKPFDPIQRLNSAEFDA